MNNRVAIEELTNELNFEQIEDSDWCQKWVAHTLFYQ